MMKFAIASLLTALLSINVTCIASGNEMLYRRSKCTPLEALANYANALPHGHMLADVAVNVEVQQQCTSL